MAGPATTTRRIPEPAQLPDPAGPTPVCKPYVSVAELAALTPWTPQAIRLMVSRGVLREGEHVFHVGRRTVFKWAAIVAFIEQGRRPPPRVPHYRDQLSLWDENGKSAGRGARSR